MFWKLPEYLPVVVGSSPTWDILGVDGYRHALVNTQKYVCEGICPNILNKALCFLYSYAILFWKQTIVLLFYIYFLVFIRHLFSSILWSGKCTCKELITPCPLPWVDDNLYFFIFLFMDTLLGLAMLASQVIAIVLFSRWLGALVHKEVHHVTQEWRILELLRKKDITPLTDILALRPRIANHTARITGLRNKWHNIKCREWTQKIWWVKVKCAEYTYLGHSLLHHDKPNPLSKFTDEQLIKELESRNYLIMPR